MDDDETTVQSQASMCLKIIMILMKLIPKSMSNRTYFKNIGNFNIVTVACMLFIGLLDKEYQDYIYIYICPFKEH